MEEKRRRRVLEEGVGRAVSVCFVAAIQLQGNTCNHKLMDTHAREGEGRGTIHAIPGIASCVVECKCDIRYRGWRKRALQEVRRSQRISYIYQ
jgi:hypothetical protein